MRANDIRNALQGFIISNLDYRERTVLVNELGICEGSVRVDMAVVNGIIHGYEIKSEFDNLRRLPLQQELYSKAFDKVSIVISKCHCEKVFEQVPEWWGVYVVESLADSSRVKELRKPKQNPSLDPFTMVQLLWKDETLAILKKIGHVNNLSKKSRHELWELLTASVSKETLATLVREQLKTRANWRSDSILVPSGG